MITFLAWYVIDPPFQWLWPSRGGSSKVRKFSEIFFQCFFQSTSLCSITLVDDVWAHRDVLKLFYHWNPLVWKPCVQSAIYSLKQLIVCQNSLKYQLTVRILSNNRYYGPYYSPLLFVAQISRVGSIIHACQGVFRLNRCFGECRGAKIDFRPNFFRKKSKKILFQESIITLRNTSFGEFSHAQLILATFLRRFLDFWVLLLYI